MKNILENWQTSLLGSGVLTAGIVYWVQNPTQWQHALVLIVTGVMGLLAKDGSNTPTV